MRDGLAFLSTVCNCSNGTLKGPQLEINLAKRYLFSAQGLTFPGDFSSSENPGKIYILDLLHPNPTPLELQIKGNLDLDSFIPHGISTYTDEAGDASLSTLSLVLHHT